MVHVDCTARSPPKSISAPTPSLTTGKSPDMGLFAPQHCHCKEGSTSHTNLSGQLDHPAKHPTDRKHCNSGGKQCDSGGSASQAGLAQCSSSLCGWWERREGGIQGHAPSWHPFPAREATSALQALCAARNQSMEFLGHGTGHCMQRCLGNCRHRGAQVSVLPDISDLLTQSHRATGEAATATLQGRGDHWCLSNHPSETG